MPVNSNKHPLPILRQAADGVRLDRFDATTPEACGRNTWKPVATHSHHLRTGRCDYERLRRHVVEWCRTYRIRALGLGSPWEPVSAASYRRFEHEGRDLYYSPDFDHRSVRDEDHVRRCIDEFNALAGPETLVYLDNETPKSRYGHLWWFGWHYEFPAWHDYSQDRPVQYYEGDPHVEINRRTGLPHRRRPCLQIVAEQRAHGALGIWAHPTSWWLGAKGEFVANIAAELPMHLLADGCVDGMTVMGYDACHRCYQKLWFHLLDRGYRVPAFAECDVCFDRGCRVDIDRPLLNWLPLAEPVTLEGIVAAAKTGANILSPSSWLKLTVDDVPMGSVCVTDPRRTHRVRVDWFPADGASGGTLELVGRGGRPIGRLDDLRPGSWFFCVPGAIEMGYLVARAFGPGQNPDLPQKQIRDFALTNPVYLRASGHTEPKPVATTLDLSVRPGSPWEGARVFFETAGGEPLGSAALSSAPFHETLPASARLRLRSTGGEESIRYLAMENLRVQALLRYLYDGEFRADFSGLSGGEVPPEAFRFDELREALSAVELEV